MKSAPFISPTSMQLVAQTQAVELLLKLEEMNFEGRVFIDAESVSGEIEFSDGDVTHAHYGNEVGRSALRQILSLPMSEWTLENCRIERGKPVVTSISTLLARDESSQRYWNDLCARAPAMGSVLRLTVAAERVRDLEPNSFGHLFSLIDGARTVSQILEQSRLDPVKSLEELVQAVDDGMVQVIVGRPSLFPLGSRGGPSVGTRRDNLPEVTLETGQLPDGVTETGVQQRRGHAPSIEPVPPIANSNARGEPPPSQAPLSRSRQFIGRYELLTRIGHGGMGTVYLCRTQSEQTGFRRHFALKLLRSHLSDDPQSTEAFLAEARIAGVIHHANVIGVLDAGFHEHRPYLVMDYVEGGSLRQLLGGAGERRPELLLPILFEALAGLCAVHTLKDDSGASLGLVHCDISPENLLVGVDGICRLTDFGISRSVHLAGPGTTQGKLGYVAPEQIGDRSFDQRADLFSMGVVLWTSLVGRELFSGRDLERRLTHPFDVDIPAPSAVGANSSKEIDRVVLRALASDPRQRYDSAHDMLEALREAAQVTWPIGSTRDVAEWVRNTVGAELALRRLTVLDISRNPSHPARDFPSIQFALPKDAPTETEPLPLTRVSSSPPKNGTHALGHGSTAAIVRAEPMSPKEQRQQGARENGRSARSPVQSASGHFYVISDFLGPIVQPSSLVNASSSHPPRPKRASGRRSGGFRLPISLLVVFVAIAGLLGFLIADYFASPSTNEGVTPASR